MDAANSGRSGWGHLLAHAYEDRAVSADTAPGTGAVQDMAMAEAIIARAHEMGIPVHESLDLVAASMHFDLDQKIPPALYQTVAEVLAWVYRLEHNEERDRR
jgi:flagellar biosynthesis protein